MTWDLLLTDISCLATCDPGAGAPAPSTQSDAGIIEHGALALQAGRVAWAGPMSSLPHRDAREIRPLAGSTVTPAWVDPHTHLPYAGERSGEFARRVAGASYESIAREGGGILSSMRSVRAANDDALLAATRARLARMAQLGTAVVEAKSGYGLGTEHELRQLRVLRVLETEGIAALVPTFLGAHSVPPEFKGRSDDYVDLVCEEMLPAVAAEGLARFADVFVEEGVFTLDQGRRIFARAAQLGMGARVHADELTPLGGAELAAEIGAASADHLICVTDRGIEALKNGGVTAVLLPGTSFFLGKPWAPARKLIEAGVPVALATDHNPGSCTAMDMKFIGHLAVCGLRMSPAEALVAMTRNAAASLGLGERFGSLAPGKSGKFLVHGVPSLEQLFYWLP